MISAPRAVTTRTSFLYKLLLMTFTNLMPRKNPIKMAGDNSKFKVSVSLLIVFQTKI